ncbi:MAG: BlaI/MecI/CopY family transcriptional regulator [Candidatus Melainabacteria bacterium]|jgi:predicted transcriptional regulator|nr:BlaI/MecI/CopY family transcriptional regulator [Candidatus Melainabacteria bacterium]MBX9672522.1 BlaI/MecI/CopY family transcriptional regulator [Candidatus Obscuribacterales bacterium]
MRLEDQNASFRYNQIGLRKFLGDLECEIMELVWKLAQPTVTVRDVFNALRKEREIAYTTVMTTMVRLSEKGLLKIVDKIGLANCYMPEYDREEFINTAVNMILEIFTSQFPKESQEFLDQMQAKLARKQARKK